MGAEGARSEGSPHPSAWVGGPLCLTHSSGPHPLAATHPLGLSGRRVPPGPEV